MKYYVNAEGRLYADPTDKKIEEFSLEEVQTPCYNGSRLPNHRLASDVDTDEGGKYYEYYNEDGTVDSGTQTSHTEQKRLKVEYEWAISILESSDIQITYHREGSTRAVATLYDWYAYRESVRDYGSKVLDSKTGTVVYVVNDVSGNIYTYNDTEYTVEVNSNGRPIEPSDTVKTGGSV
jgi:hypothetical protein